MLSKEGMELVSRFFNDCAFAIHEYYVNNNKQLTKIDTKTFIAKYWHWIKKNNIRHIAWRNDFELTTCLGDKIKYINTSNENRFLYINELLCFQW